MESAFTLPEDIAPALDRPAPATPLSVFASLLAECQATSSKTAKQDAVRLALDGPRGADVLKLLTYALSPYIRFHVQQLPEATGVSIRPVDTELVYQTLDALSSRRITGGAARDVIKMILELTQDTGGPVSEREALRRVLLKDLRAGFDTSTVNKAKKGAIAVFKCQLAEDASRCDLSKDLVYPLAVEPKYDGVRVVAIKKAGVVTLFSRNGIPFENFAEINAYLEQWMPDEFVLDGEVLHAWLLGEEGFKAVMKRAKASPGKSTNIPIRYQAFDAMYLMDWESQVKTGPLANRRMRLCGAAVTMPIVKSHVDPRSSPIFGVAPQTIANDARQLEELYRGYVADGFEGVIIKTLNGGYAFKRNAAWMKIKPFASADLAIAGAVEGNGKYVGMLGTFIVEGEHDGKKVRCEVGSGFSDAQRAEFWGLYLADQLATTEEYQLIGRVIEIRFQDITQAEGNENYALRFPTFVRFREVDAAGKI